MKKTIVTAYSIGLMVYLLVFCGSAVAGWKAMTSPTTKHTYALWGISASDVFIGDIDGGIYHYNGSTWSSMSSGTTREINDIWGSSASDVFAVGLQAFLHYNGSTWSSMTVPYMDYWGIWGTSATDVYAVGLYGTTLHYDGASWTSMTNAVSEHFWDVWVTPSSGEVFAVGTNGTIVHYYTGGTWTQLTSGVSTELSDIWGASENAIFAVGDKGVILFFDGSTWSSMTSNTTEILTGVWGSSATNVYAVGYNGTLLHYDGSSWSSVNSGTSKHLVTIWGSSASDIFIVGVSGTLLHYDGQSSTTTTVSSGTTTTTSVPPGNTAPTAFFEVDPSVGTTETEFTVDASGSSDAEDGIGALFVLWDWDSDGSFDTPLDAEKTATHSYPAAGTYTITLQVEDTGGLTDTTTQQVIVISEEDEGNTPPEASFGVDPPVGDTATEFTVDAAESSDAETPPENLAIRWDWETDGMWDTDFTTEKTAVHVFEAADEYLITLEVVDEGGLIDTAAMEVMVVGAEGDDDQEDGNTPPNAVVFAEPPEGDTTTEFTFVAFDSTDAEDPMEALVVRWDFESDGIWDSDYNAEKAAPYRYEVPDLYTCTVEVMDTGGLTDQAAVEVMVHDPGAEPCPIAALVDNDPQQIAALRGFRDRVLVKSRAGRLFLRTYYENQAVLREALDCSPAVRSTAAMLLSQLLQVIDQHGGSSGSDLGKHL